jgi:hypothetical protein
MSNEIDQVWTLPFETEISMTAVSEIDSEAGQNLERS